MQLHVAEGEAQADLSLIHKRMMDVGITPAQAATHGDFRTVKIGKGANVLLHAPVTRFVLKGWLLAGVNLRDGQRQELRLFLPGDIIDDAGEAPPWKTITALEESVVTFVPRSLETSEAFQILLHDDRRAKMAALHDQLVRLGRLDSLQRMAHFILEVDRRLRAGQKSVGGSMSWPMSQIQMADYLAISVVHTNRVLQTLRRENIVVLKKHLEILDRTTLQEMSEWRYDGGRKRVAPDLLA